MSVFINGKPAKKEYRHFNIKTVEGPDDFASMESNFPSVQRMLDEAQELPQLIVIDGGKGQLSSAMTSLEKFGLMRESCRDQDSQRLEEIFYPRRYRSIVHRQEEWNHENNTAVTWWGASFRNYTSPEEKRKGNCQNRTFWNQRYRRATAQALLIHFKSVKRIKEALEDLKQ